MNRHHHHPPQPPQPPQQPPHQSCEPILQNTPVVSNGSTTSSDTDSLPWFQPTPTRQPQSGPTCLRTTAKLALVRTSIATWFRENTWNSASLKPPVGITNFSAPQFAEFMAGSSFAKLGIMRASSTIKHPIHPIHPIFHRPRQLCLGLIHNKHHSHRQVLASAASTGFPASDPQLAAAGVDLVVAHPVEVEGEVVAAVAVVALALVAGFIIRIIVMQ